MNSRDLLLDRYVRTGHFRYGLPREWTVSPDGERVLFLRTRDGAEATSCLWLFDVTAGEERLLVDPDLLEPYGALLAAELFQRERKRHRTVGVTSYATDSAVGLAACAVDGRLVTVHLDTGQVRAHAGAGRAFDPRPSPDGKHIAFVADGALKLVETAGGESRTLVAPDGDGIAWGLAELIAAEELGRSRGFWWSPDGSVLLATRVDSSQLDRWYLADPYRPAEPPLEIAYPACGRANADVSLWLVHLDGRRTEVQWDRQRFEYLVWAGWRGDRPLAVVQDRSQRTVRLLDVEPGTGATTTVHETTDTCWVSLVPGVPATTRSGHLIWAADADGATRLLVDGAPVTEPRLQVRAVTAVDGDRVLFLASTEPIEVHVWEWTPQSGALPLTTEPGIWSGHAAGGTTVTQVQTLPHHGARIEVRSRNRPVATIHAVTEAPPLTPRVTNLVVGPHELRVAVVLPTGHRPDDGPLPVIVDSYGGPDGQRVLMSQDKYLLPQWFAEHGFAVVVADGRGTRGRSPEWSRLIQGDVATLMLQDQVDALHGAAEQLGCLDLTRVGIRGLSFAGYLSLLAVLRRPDVFHVAVAAGAPTDLRLYETHWMERYLGHPDEHPEDYDRCSLVNEAHLLRRPLMLVHGLLDDNVFSAHPLRMSAALLAAGRPHTVLPLPSAHNVTAQPEVERTMLTMQLAFIRDALDLPAPTAS